MRHLRLSFLHKLSYVLANRKEISYHQFYINISRVKSENESTYGLLTVFPFLGGRWNAGNGICMWWWRWSWSVNCQNTIDNIETSNRLYKHKLFMFDLVYLAARLPIWLDDTHSFAAVCRHAGFFSTHPETDTWQNCFHINVITNPFWINPRTLFFHPDQDMCSSNNCNNYI